MWLATPLCAYTTKDNNNQSKKANKENKQQKKRTEQILQWFVCISTIREKAPFICETNYALHWFAVAHMMLHMNQMYAYRIHGMFSSFWIFGNQCCGTGLAQACERARTYPYICGSDGGFAYYNKSFIQLICILRHNSYKIYYHSYNRLIIIIIRKAQILVLRSCHCACDFFFSQFSQMWSVCCIFM